MARHRMCSSLSNIYDKQDDFDFEIVNLPFLNRDVCHSFPMVYIYFAAYLLCENMF